MFVLCWVQGDSGLVTNLSGWAIYGGFRMYSTIFCLWCNKGAHECHDEQMFFWASTWCRSTIIVRMDLKRTHTCRRAARSGRLYQQQVACPARLCTGCFTGTLSSDMLFKRKIVSWYLCVVMIFFMLHMKLCFHYAIYACNCVPKKWEWALY